MMMEVMEQIPKTVLDVFRILPEGTLCEVIDNVLYMSPASKYSHQRLLLLIANRITNHLYTTHAGEVIISPFDVYFDDLQSAVQPDLLYVANANRDILKDDGCIHGAPDLIIEVLSADKRRDLVDKKSLYERAGVLEYHIADPVSKRVFGYELKHAKYQLAHEAEGRFTSRLIDLSFEF